MPMHTDTMHTPAQTQISTHMHMHTYVHMQNTAYTLMPIPSEPPTYSPTLSLLSSLPLILLHSFMFYFGSEKSVVLKSRGTCQV